MHASLFLTPITVIVLFYIDSLMACICLFLFSGKGNKMNIVRRIGAVLLSLLMIVGITTQSVNAASYKMEWHGKSTAYGSTVGNFTIDGRRAWCIEHKKTTPSNQTMSGDFYTSTEPKGLIYKVQRNKRCFINRSCEETLICLYLQTFSQEGGGKRGTAK